MPRSWLISALPGLLLAASAHADAAKFGAQLEQQLTAAGEGEVLVVLAPPELPVDDLSARRRAVDRVRAAVLPSLPTDEVRVRRQFQFASAFTAVVTVPGLRRLAAHPGVVRIEPMRRGSAALAQSVPQIRADAVHRREDTGQGVTVAVLDTGVDVTHPDLAGSIIAEECFCSDNNCCPNQTARQSGPGSAATTSIHGIHVTGIIVSKGLVAPVGVAPGAQVVAIKVLGDNGSGYLSDWLDALEWIAANRPDVRAINMSLASNDIFAGVCDTVPNPDGWATAFAQVLEPLRARGTLTFAAAGNGGQTSKMALPACVGAAVAVGEVTKTDAVYPVGNRDAALDLFAPGVSILSTGLNHGVGVLTGTSMSTPHATGTAALLFAFNPGLSADAAENVMKSTGEPLFDSATRLTFPRINALAALNTVLNRVVPLTGGGQREADCLVEWSVTPPEIATAFPFAQATCHDNDPACDGDQISGQCTFRVAACFNVPDRRLPSCSVTAPVVDYQLLTPPPPGSDGVDAGNAAAISTALPEAPITASNLCSASIPIVVPVTTRPGTRWIRLSARASDGRVDQNRLRLTCLPAAP